MLLTFRDLDSASALLPEVSGVWLHRALRFAKCQAVTLVAVIGTLRH